METSAKSQARFLLRVDWGANGFNSGLKLSGTYTVDTATAGLLPTGLPIQIYNGSVTDLNLSIGNYAAVLQGGGTNSTTLSSGNPALYSVNLGTAGNLVKGFAPSLFSINLADETGILRLAVWRCQAIRRPTSTHLMSTAGRSLSAMVRVWLVHSIH